MKKNYLLLAMMLFVICSMYGQDSSVEERIVSDVEALTVATDYYERNQSLVTELYENLQNDFLTNITDMADFMRCSGMGYCELRSNKDVYPEYFVDAGDVENISQMFSTFRAELGSDSRLTNYVDVTNTLDRYFRAAQSLDYTKMEVFEDFTGYTDPLEYYGNYLLPSDRERTVNGRGMIESLERVEGIADGRIANTKCFTVAFERQNTSDLATNPLGQSNLSALSGNLSLQAFPNPYSSEVNVTFELPEQDNITLTAFDLNGRLIRTLSTGLMDKGLHAINWDGRSDSGAVIGDGVYYLVIRSSTDSQVMRIIKKNINQK